GNAASEGVDHERIGEDRCIHLSIVTDGDQLPGFVSPELGEGKSTRHFHRVLVLCGNGDAAQDAQHRDKCSSQHSSALHRRHLLYPVCWHSYFPLLLYLRTIHTHAPIKPTDMYRVH